MVEAARGGGGDEGGSEEVREKGLGEEGSFSQGDRGREASAEEEELVMIDHEMRDLLNSLERAAQWLS